MYLLSGVTGKSIMWEAAKWSLDITKEPFFPVYYKHIVTFIATRQN